MNHALRNRALVMAEVQAAVDVLVDELLAAAASHAGFVPPRPVIELMFEMVLAPDPNRRAIARALAWLAGEAPGSATEVVGYLEFDVVGAGALPPHELGRQLDVVARALRSVEGWLGGARLLHEQIGDRASVTVLDARLGRNAAAVWPQLIRSCRGAWQRCADRDVPVRAAVCVGPASRVQRADGRSGVAGPVQRVVDEVLERTAWFRGDLGERRDGLALVLDAASPLSAEALWAAAGGELLEVCSSQTLEGRDGCYLVHVRTRLGAPGAPVPPRF
jgi:hypothetical protein